MKNLPVITGKNIYLRALCEEDAKGNYPCWLNDTEVTKYNSHGSVNYTIGMAIEYIKMVEKSSSHQVFAIVEKSTHKHLGNISLQAIDFSLLCAEFAILIGEPLYYGKGLGYEAGKLLINYGFDKLNLKTIYCGTSEKNIGMQRLAIKLGMKENGYQKNAFTKDKISINVIKYKIIQDP